MWRKYIRYLFGELCKSHAVYVYNIHGAFIFAVIDIPFHIPKQRKYSEEIDNFLVKTLYYIDREYEIMFPYLHELLCFDLLLFIYSVFFGGEGKS